VVLGVAAPAHANGNGVAGGPGIFAGSSPYAHTYRPPVVAPVADPFRPPPAPWLAGNRGIEYATPPGTIVRAIGPGVVTFAGRVAGQLDVTVTHPDGLRSSYVDLAFAGVRVGDRVLGGDVVGRSTDRLHLGVRRGRTYLDPASLWGRRVRGGRVVLVPVGGTRRPTLGASPWDRYHRRSAHRPVDPPQTAGSNPRSLPVHRWRSDPAPKKPWERSGS
jgi:murein DD-endopeptidase MepM/ murein hydrolase activator NlpD